MRVVVQRVLEASVTIDGKLHSRIGPGLLVLAGWEEADTTEDNEWIAQKISKMRLFPDAEGVMNRSVVEAGGDPGPVSGVLPWGRVPWGWCDRVNLELRHLTS